MTKKAKYHHLSGQERLQFHAVRCFYHALYTWDTFEAYRQSCIAASVSKQVKDFQAR